jgi:hypothetical protein
MALPTPVNGTSRVKPGRRDALRQVIALQRAAYQVGLALAADSQATESREERARVATAFGNISKAFVSLQDCKRELRGKPRLKPIEPPKRERKRPMFSGPLDIDTGPFPDPQQPSRRIEDEVKWEMQDVPGHPGVQVQVVLDSPALRAERANQAKAAAPLPTSPLTSPAPIPPQPTHPAERPAVASAPVPSPMIIRERPLPPGAVRRQLVHGPNGRLVWKPEKS